MRFQAPRGTEDVLPADSYKWRRLEAAFVGLVESYGYREIRTPTFEDYALFVRSAGETSDVVSKQMYDFTDKGGRHICLKAEGTAPAMRAMIEGGLLQAGTTHRIFYITPVFRYERPQKGRLREHHQVGVECIGFESAAADAEVISIAVGFYRSLGLEHFVVKLNSIGRAQCRAAYRRAILEHAAAYLTSLDSGARAKAEANPMRLLDSKDPNVQEVVRGLPPITDYLEPESSTRLAKVEELLTNDGISYEIDPRIVRGLDYYTETVFELQVGTIGATQNAIGGGGRYDDLISELGGPKMPSVGFGIGVERALIALDSEGVDLGGYATDVFVVAAGEAHFTRASQIAKELRANGLIVEQDLDLRSLKSQLKQADRANSRFALILGDDEVAKNMVTLRDMKTSSQELTTLEAAMARIGR